MPRILASNHTHTQDTASENWTIAHGLNCKPSVAVNIDYEGQLQAVVPSSIEFPDNNTVIVRFTQPYTGTARLS